MRRISDTSSRHLPPVRIFRDDLEELVSQLRSEGAECKVIYKQTEYDSLDEFLEHIKRDYVRSLTLEVSGPSWPYGMTVSLEPDEVTIHTPNQNPAVAALIADSLRSRVPWYSWRPSGNWWYGLQGALSFVLVAATIVTLPTFLSADSVWSFPLVGFVSAALILLAFRGRVWLGATRVYLVEADSRMSFWKRNRDQLIVATISSAVSGFVGFVLGRITS